MQRLFGSRFVWIGILFAALFTYAYVAHATEVSNVEIKNVGQTSADIAWNTDVESDATINYGLDDSFGVVRDPKLGKAHVLKIGNLDPATTYYFRLVSADASGNTNATAGFQFTTRGTPNVQKVIKEIKQLPPEDLQLIKETPEVKPPAIVGSPKVVPTEDGAIMTWVTDRDSDSQVLLAAEGEFNPKASKPYSIQQGNPKEVTTRHSVTVIGLESATTYHFSVSSTDLQGLTGVSEDDTFETRAQLPIPQNIKVTKIQENSATVSWTTPVLAKGVVSYTNLRTKAVKTTGSPIFADKQTVNITGLEFGTKYTGIITGTNKAGDNYDSKPFSFITVRDVVPPVITKVKNESTLFPSEDVKVQTIISWDTDEAANCQVFYAQGLVHDATSEGDSFLIETNPLTKHTQVIVGFAPGTVYKFWIKCDDVAGNQSQSDDFVLITPIKEKNIIDIILENFQGTFGWVNKVGK